MTDAPEPYFYCREHDDVGWSVRGPNGFWLAAREKNLAFAIAMMLNGRGQDGSKLIGGMFLNDVPDYLTDKRRK